VCQRACKNIFYVKLLWNIRYNIKISSIRPHFMPKFNLSYSLPFFNALWLNFANERGKQPHSYGL
jgi:hypothetical protein